MSNVNKWIVGLQQQMDRTKLKQQQQHEAASKLPPGGEPDTSGRHWREQLQGQVVTPTVDEMLASDDPYQVRRAMMLLQRGDANQGFIDFDNPAEVRSWARQIRDAHGWVGTLPGEINPASPSPLPQPPNVITPWTFTR